MPWLLNLSKRYRGLDPLHSLSTIMAASPPSPFLSSMPCHSNPAAFKAPILLPKVRRRRWKQTHLLAVRALREWSEYEDAVKEKDLARALRFLKSVGTLPLQSSQSPMASSLVRPKPAPSSELLPWPERDWEVLDTCLNADDMRLVGSAYSFLQDRGLLPNFGKCKNIVLEGPRDVTPTVLKESTGLDAYKFAPKKWGLSGNSRTMLLAFLAGVSFLVYQGIDIRPNLAAILALGALDAIFLGGSCLAQILSLWPPYRRRVLVHEAGHLLTAYLMGCPVRGVILDPIVAMQMGIQGQLRKAGRLASAKCSVPSWPCRFPGNAALRLLCTSWNCVTLHCSGFLIWRTNDPSCSTLRDSCAHCSSCRWQLQLVDEAGTQFWDETLENELAEGHLSGTAFDRYCMVLFAGMAAEALVYGEAEGGENDENLFRSVCVLLQPPMSIAQMANQARWSLLQSYNLLKWHRQAHRAAVKALESGYSLSTVIRRIEEAISTI
ncbi:hypothetical protein Taro_048991 [Colocasia esculenta]|uniref:ATP-dependent zinc metalloprotease n=1 Tax=Colocasia esculenta TaxID=4460 RepID=A0A843X9V3_COLES|nr:hypothetical protein [Colocasia esculenta]